MDMKKSLKVIAVLAVISLCLIGVTSAAGPVVHPQYSIESLTISPGVLQPGEQGTVTVVLKNEGTTTLNLSKAQIRDSTGGTYSSETTLTSFGSIAAGSKTTLKFPITAKQNQGTFYPELYIEFSSEADTGSYYTYLKYPFELVIDSNVLYTSINQRPAVFVPNKPAVLGVTVANLRDETVHGVQISVSGDGVTSTEGTVYVGDLDNEKNRSANASLTVITSEESSGINLDITYRTGNNWHKDTILVPIAGSAINKDADIVITNIVATKNGDTVTVTGDVSNAGLSPAKSMVVTTRGVQTVQPYPSYVIGELDEDSLSEFEVSFIPNKGDESVTLAFNYKDTNGNARTYNEIVSIEDTASSSGGSGSNPVLATVIIIILAGIIVVLVIVIWRRGKITKKEKQE